MSCGTKVIRATSMSNFYFFLSLRQGTILIALLELSLSLFSVILLLLCLVHTNRLVELVTSDVKYYETHTFLEKSETAVNTYVINNNENKMLAGQHLAVIVRVTVSIVLFVTVFYIISTALLLYGAIRKSPNFLLPWIAFSFSVLLTALFWLLPFSYFVFDTCNLILVWVLLLMLYPFQIHAWLTVFSYYRQLTGKQLIEPPAYVNC